MSIEAMKQALEALEKVLPCAEENFTNPSLQIEIINAYAAITSLRQALSEAQLSVNENSHAIEQASSVSSIQSDKTSDAEKQEPIKIDGNTSDGYHTFNELYEFRKAYNVALFNEWASGGKCSVHKSWRHHDGELCFGGGWFIVVAVLPQGQISNHYEAKDWNLFAIPEVERALFEFDGHTGNDVIERLETYTTPQPQQEPVAYPDGYVVGPCICGSWPGGKCLKCPRITPQPQRERVIFPTMLRKMWSGGEVQAWLDENVNKEKNHVS